MPDKFQHILRVMNTNLDGKKKVIFALRGIKGVGLRFAQLACRKAGVTTSKRAGELSDKEVSAPYFSVLEIYLHFVKF